VIDKAKLTRVAVIVREDLPTLRQNAADPAKDRTGGATEVVRQSLRRLAVAAWHLDSSVADFRRLLQESGQLKIQLCERRISGEPIDDALVSVLGYLSVFDLLSSGAVGEAQRLAQLIGSVQSRAGVTELDEALGHGVRHVVLNDVNATLVRVADLEPLCEETKRRPFAGYADLLAGIVQQDRTRCENGLASVLAGHRQLAKRGGLFDGLPDAYLCFGGLGLGNLARQRGIHIEIPNDEFLPKALLL
jgi:hypothetical protein